MPRDIGWPGKIIRRNTRKRNRTVNCRRRKMFRINPSFIASVQTITSVYEVDAKYEVAILS